MFDTENLCMGCMNDNGGEQVCSICGYDSTKQNHSQALPTKFVLENRFVVGKVLSANGEGITYIGFDKSTEKIVKIKEYFPMGVAVRNPDATVSIIADKKYAFNEGLLEFMDINRFIMRQAIPAVESCFGVFECGGTAYAVLENIQGITLRDFLDRNGGTLKWEQARALLLPLIDAIKEMNDNGMVHKGISPETIIVGRDGKLYIKDYSINNLRLQGNDIESELYDGYAAVEQYGIYEMPVGAFTDVYSFSATLFNVLVGTDIPKATVRVSDQSLSIPARFVEVLPRHVLAALANGLKVKPSERTQDFETFKNELVYGEIPEPESKPAVQDISSKKPTKEQKRKKQKSNVKYALISALATVLAFLVVAAALVFTVFKDDIFGNESAASDSALASSAPEVDEIGSVDSDAVESVKLYKVPDFKGKTYAEIIDDEENDIFEFVIKAKVFSKSYSKGEVCEQSVKKDEEVERDTKIELTISLGAEEFKMPNVVGLDETSAKLELMKAGFLYENIEVLEKYDEQSEPGIILAQSPENKKKVNAESAIKIYKNTYEGEPPMGDADDSAILSDIMTTTP